MIENNNEHLLEKAKQLLLEERFGIQLPSERDFGIRSRDRHIAYEVLKKQMPELDEFMPDRISLKTLHKMRRDPMIQLGLHFIKVPLINAKWEIVGPAGREVEADFIKWALDRVWMKLMSNMLLALEFGYVGIVKKWAYERPPDELEIWSASVDPVVPDDVFALYPQYIEPRFTKGGKFNGITYHAFGEDPKEIPDEYCLWFTNDLDPSFGNYYGFPRIGYGYPYWRSYWFRWLLYDRHFEQDADPPLVIWGPSGNYHDEEGNIHWYRDEGLAVGESLRSGGTIYLPSTPYFDAQTDKPSQAKQWDAEFMYGGSNIEGFQSTFEYLDVMKLRSILVPEQALVEGKGGTSSRNVAATYGAAFMESQTVLIEQIDRLVNWYFVDKIAEYNFGAKPGTFKKKTKSFLEENADLWGEIMKAVASTDPLKAKIDLAEMAKRLEMPQLTDEQVDEIEAKEEEKFVKQMEAQTAANIATSTAKQSEKPESKPTEKKGS